MRSISKTNQSIVVSARSNDFLRLKYSLAHIKHTYKMLTMYIYNFFSMFSVRSSLIEATSEFLFNARTQEYSAVDCLDYGRSLLYLLHLLMSKEIQRLSVTLCCYYGCRDLGGFQLLNLVVKEFKGHMTY